MNHGTWYRLCLAFIACIQAAFMLNRFAHVGTEGRTNNACTHTYSHTFWYQESRQVRAHSWLLQWQDVGARLINKWPVLKSIDFNLCSLEYIVGRYKLRVIHWNAIHPTNHKSRDFGPFSIIVWCNFFTFQVAWEIIEDARTENRFQVSHSIVNLWLIVSHWLENFFYMEFSIGKMAP